ncbi:hypothetical protein C2G38_2299835 [Gigaspora rosea]|uniref:Uncharacterized protein n=1 Tax=Gigaspora rosea TaxID=44941 RepID=A0A397VJG3_9GLOM|nr:hypothetical protein C2G38_2299835 [Gigaspora rosea]
MDLLYEALFNFEESPEFDTGIEQTVVHDNALTFDWYSYNKIKEMIRSVEETDELIESNELFESDNNEIEIFNAEFDLQIPSDIDCSTRFTNCAVIDNEISNKSTIIQRCNNVGVRSVNQLAVMWRGHLHVRPGIKKLTITCEERGEHNADTTLALSLKENIESVSFLAPLNVVILKAGEAPSKNENVHQAVDMYLEDFGYTENGVLNLVCDKAIYRRIKDYKNEEQEVCCILGQRHTNKTMCNALIVAFSGYGLFGLVTQLGVKFLDKLEQNVDYRSTFQVLELIWIAVGVVLHRYIQENNISIEEIPAESNNLLKVWYNFYRWAGYLKLHKLGIRIANFDLQMHSLMAFAPLFPITKRISFLISEFTEDRSVGKNSRAVKDRQEAFWMLIDELKTELSDSQSKSHTLFAKTTQLTTAGYRQMFNCYQSGIDKMNKVVAQVILSSARKVKIEHDELDLIPMKIMKRNKLEKEASQTVTINIKEVSSSSIHALEKYDMEIEETNQDIQVLSSGSKSRKLRISHKINPEEKEILLQLKRYKNSPLLPKEFVNKLVEELSSYENWTSK